MPPRRHDDEDDEASKKRQVLEDAARIAELDSILERRVMKVVDDHEDRIRDMEKWQSRMMGMGTVFGFLVTIMVGVCTWTLTDEMRRVRESVAHQAPLPPTGGRGR